MASLHRKYLHNLMLLILVVCCVVPISFMYLRKNILWNQKFTLQRISMEEGSETTRGHSPACTPARNVFFLKVHKTGSTTMYGILNRRAIKHSLKVVTYNKDPLTEPRKTHSIIHNIIPEFTIGGSEQFNMLINHASFVRDDIEAVLKPPIFYITMLRDPLSQIRSWYYFIGKGKEKKNNRKSYYDPLTKESYIRGVHGKFNEVAKQFGASKMMLANQTNFKIYLDYLDKIFLVGITKYYAQSLVYFKRRLCWNLEDLVHIHLRKGKYHERVIFDQKEDAKLHREICALHSRDCELYEHFNRTFWTQVQQEGKDFFQEVEHFQNIIQNVSSFCSSTFACIDMKGSRQQNPPLWIAGSEWSSGFEITGNDCALMSMNEPTVTNYHYYAQNVDGCFKLNDSKSKKCIVQPKHRGPKFCDGLCKHAPNKTKMLLDLLETRGTCME